MQILLTLLQARARKITRGKRSTIDSWFGRVGFVEERGIGAFEIKIVSNRVSASKSKVNGVIARSARVQMES